MELREIFYAKVNEYSQINEYMRTFLGMEVKVIL